MNRFFKVLVATMLFAGLAKAGGTAKGMEAKEQAKNTLLALGGHTSAALDEYIALVGKIRDAEASLDPAKKAEILKGSKAARDAWKASWSKEAQRIASDLSALMPGLDAQAVVGLLTFYPEAIQTIAWMKVVDSTRNDSKRATELGISEADVKMSALISKAIGKANGKYSSKPAVTAEEKEDSLYAGAFFKLVSLGDAADSVPNVEVLLSKIEKNLATMSMKEAVSKAVKEVNGDKTDVLSFTRKLIACNKKA